MKRTLVAPKTYQDAQGRFYARPCLKGRRTWRLIVNAKGKPERRLNVACAIALRDDWQPASDTFAALAALYLAAQCPTRKQKFKQPTPEFISAETRQTGKLVSYFRARPVAEVNDLLQIEPYAKWRLKQFADGKGSRAVDKEIQTLSNIINYAVFGTKQERLNFIMQNRPRYHVVKSPSRDRMPESADIIHQLADHFLTASRHDGRALRSEVFAWLNLFQMFTGCRTSELLRLRLDAKPGEAGSIAGGQLHLGRRSKGGIDPWVNIGPEFAQMIECYKRWHADRFPKSPVYFPGATGKVVNDTGHVKALMRACRTLGLPHITPHGFRAYYVTKRRRDGANDNVVAAEIGDTTVALISVTYGRNTGGTKLTWMPSQGMPSWSLWQPAAAKITRIA